MRKVLEVVLVSLLATGCTCKLYEDYSKHSIDEYNFKDQEGSFVKRVFDRKVSPQCELLEVKTERRVWFFNFNVKKEVENEIIFEIIDEFPEFSCEEEGTFQLTAFMFELCDEGVVRMHFKFNSAATDSKLTLISRAYNIPYEPRLRLDAYHNAVNATTLTKELFESITIGQDCLFGAQAYIHIYWVKDIFSVKPPKLDTSRAGFSPKNKFYRSVPVTLPGIWRLKDLNTYIRIFPKRPYPAND